MKTTPATKTKKCKCGRMFEYKHKRKDNCDVCSYEKHLIYAMNWRRNNPDYMKRYMKNYRSK